MSFLANPDTQINAECDNMKSLRQWIGQKQVIYQEKWVSENLANPLILLVRPEGFEPPTPGFEGRTWLC